jgi:hypothetical protein
MLTKRGKTLRITQVSSVLLIYIFTCAFTERKDLFNYLKDIPCQKQRPHQNLLDANLKLGSIKILSKETDNFRKTVEENFFDTNIYHSLAWKKCNSSSHMYLLSPAPRAAKLDKETLQLPLKDIYNLCSKYKLKYIKASHGSSSSLKLASKIDISQLSPGHISLACLLKKHPQIGYHLWFMIPIGGSKKKIIFSKEKIIPWIQHIRKDHKLDHLEDISINLKEQLELLIKTNSSFHNNKQLSQIRKSMSKQYTLIGENRAIANSMQETIQLFWNSPEHRDLLLSKKASHIGVMSKTINSQILTTIIIARRTHAK